ncbi:hypothetical protein MHYP_G00156600 [Metynnis hypsauchen]
MHNYALSRSSVLLYGKCTPASVDRTSVLDTIYFCSSSSFHYKDSGEMKVFLETPGQSGSILCNAWDQKPKGTMMHYRENVTGHHHSFEKSDSVQKRSHILTDWH